MTLGMIVGNRGFFPDHLARTGHQEMKAALEAAGVDVIVLTEADSKYGAVETRQEAANVAALFAKHREAMDGVVVTLPNFGDERAIADTLRLAGLSVAVLVQATPDTPSKMTIRDRRDSFLREDVGLQQLDAVRDSLFADDVAYGNAAIGGVPEGSGWFLAVCRVVKGLRRLRIGAIGARPAAFNTVRYSEKILERSGISVETVDLSEILGRVDRMKDGDAAAQGKLTAIKKYVEVQNIPDAALLKMAKLGAVIDGWMRETEVAISAIQCWTALEEYFGVVPCTVMSMMSNDGLSSACEVDIAGVVGMHALQLASETPSALLDWNNNYADDPDKAVCFHCSNCRSISSKA